MQEFLSGRVLGNSMSSWKNVFDQSCQRTWPNLMWQGFGINEFSYLKHHEKKELVRRVTFLENCFVSSKSHVQTVPLVQTPPLKRCLTLRILSR